MDIHNKLWISIIVSMTQLWIFTIVVNCVYPFLIWVSISKITPVSIMQLWISIIRGYIRLWLFKSVCIYSISVDTGRNCHHYVERLQLFLDVIMTLLLRCVSVGIDIARTWRQPNYPNQLATKRGSLSSLMFDPNPMWWANGGNLIIVQAGRGHSQQGVLSAHCSRQPLIAPLITCS